MMENYVYPDTHEMFDLHDTLEELISKESYDIGLGLGSRVDSDPDLEYLLEVLFTPVEARCSYLDIWGSKKYPDIITDIKDGKFMDMSMEEFEEKREKWVKEIRDRSSDASYCERIKYGREVNDWEIKLHLQNLVSRQKNVLVYMQVCQNMITHGFSLTQISQAVPWVDKSDIYGLFPDARFIDGTDSGGAGRSGTGIPQDQEAKGIKGSVRRRIEMKNELVLFTDGEVNIEVQISPEQETVWLTQKQMEILFEVKHATISEHISNILSSGELDETSVGFSDKSTGGRKPKIYNLDMILSVGYRVNSKRGIAFRRWANNVLKQYIIQGYAINEKRLAALQKQLISRPGCWHAL